MIAEIKKGIASGSIVAPPSKSFAHRLIICAALADGKSVIRDVEPSNDIDATLDCIRALGADVSFEGKNIHINGLGSKIMTKRRELPDISCRESGSTLRFMLPISLLCGGARILGTERLIERGIGVYEQIFASRNVDFTFKKEEILLHGNIEGGVYKIAGNVSSQFISGMLFALPLLDKDSVIEVLPPFESRSYVDITVDILSRFGICIECDGENIFRIRKNQSYCPADIAVEGDWSQAAFFYGLNLLGGKVDVLGLNNNSLQGDRVCLEIFEQMKRGRVDADLSNCPDLAPILFAIAALKGTGKFTGTRRLAIKESNRAEVMAQELAKFGADISVYENFVEIKAKELHTPQIPLESHNDHRIVIALSVLATAFGGRIEGAEAINKSYPKFFDDMKRLGLEMNIYDS
jgi:3-phosphoshikimate 1-carboxyvinyltransferase